MLSIRRAAAWVSGVMLLSVIGSLLLKTRNPPPITLAALFDEQFDRLEQLTLSLTRSIPHTKCLRIHSVAFEDLSYALAASQSDDLAQVARSLSHDIDTFARLLQGLYVEIDVMVHLTTATSHVLGKLLERQSTTQLPLRFCQYLRTFVRCQAPSRFFFSLHNHFDTLSNALTSLDSFMTDVSLARQRLQHRVGTAVAAIARATDISAGEGCDIFLALWDLSDEDGEGFSGSIRNSAAFRVFCTQLAGLVHQLDEDLASIRALQHVLTAFSLVHASDSPPDIHPSFSATLIKRVHTLIRFRAVGMQGYNHDQHTVEAL